MAVVEMMEMIVIGVGLLGALIWCLPVISEAWSLLRLRRGVASRTDFGTDPEDAGQGNDEPSLLFLVPAHDEAELIGDCVRSLLAMRRDGVEFEHRVIADNCTDRTADIVRDEGGRVLERSAPDDRGKPAAIQWALDRLPYRDFDAVVIVDADTVVDPGFATALASKGPLEDKAVQAYFDVSNRDASWLARLGSLLAQVRYEGQYVLKDATDLNVPLTGNGMCLGTRLLERRGWPSKSLTENWELYGRYTAGGERIELARDAHLRSHEAASLSQASIQRKRWQAGRFHVLLKYGVRILTSRKIGWHQKVDALSELGLPSPALHGALAFVGAAVALILPRPFGGTIALLLVAAPMPLVARAVTMAVRRPDRGELAWAACRLPVYVTWRLFVGILSISTARAGAWIRSPRGQESGT